MEDPSSRTSKALERYGYRNTKEAREGKRNDNKSTMKEEWGLSFHLTGMVVTLTQVSCTSLHGYLQIRCQPRTIWCLYRTNPSVLEPNTRTRRHTEILFDICLYTRCRLDRSERCGVSVCFVLSTASHILVFSTCRSTCLYARVDRNSLAPLFFLAAI